MQTCFLANFPYFFKVFIGKLSSCAAGWLPSSSTFTVTKQVSPKKELSLTAKKLLLSRKQYIWLFEESTLLPWFFKPVEHNSSILTYICLARFLFPAFILPASDQKCLIPIVSQLMGLSGPPRTGVLQPQLSPCPSLRHILLTQTCLGCYFHEQGDNQHA